nr:MFS transporter [uncultured Bartonella sp.]
MYLWFWGVGGVCGSILIGYVVDVYDLKKILFFILSLLFIAFLAVFVFSKINLILIALPLIIWGAVGWALQVPQNNELLKLREQSGDGNLAVGLNQSSVYLGGSLGTIFGGILVSFGASPSSLPLYYMLPIIISILLLVVRRKS